MPRLFRSFPTRRSSDLTAYACMSENMMLALEGRAESFTLGKDVSVAQVEETIRLAEKHGFELAEFRAFEKVVGPEAIARADRKSTRLNSSHLVISYAVF